jgi:hypothetical protein
MASLTIGQVFVPQLGIHVPYEGFGEKALLQLLSRWYPRISRLIAQPPRITVTVDGKKRRYTPDFELGVPGQQDSLLEVRSAHRLQDERVQRHLAAVELEAGRLGFAFRQFFTSELTRSIELRNTRLMRRYALHPLSPEVADALRSPFHKFETLTLSDMVLGAADHGIALEQVYAALYQGVLTFDWDGELLGDSTLLQLGAVRANV